MARVADPAALIETLKLLHVHGALAGRRIISASCSGGEATLVADLAQPRGLELPAPPAAAHQRLHDLLGEKVHVANPLDYHTYIWADLKAQTACFSGLLDCGFDMHLLVLDFPRTDRCDDAAWQCTVDAFIAACAGRAQAGAVVASLPESLPEAVAQRLLAHGIAPMHGIGECLDAVVRAAQIGAAQARAERVVALAPTHPVTGAARALDEPASKQALAAFGLPIPAARVVDANAAAAAADALGYPVVVKAVSAELAHKTEAGGVRLNLGDANAVAAAVAAMAPLSDRFLVERMATDVVAEFILGVHRDPQFGLALTLGAGGVLVELLRDSATLLLPVARADVVAALAGLRTWPLVCGYRARPAGDIDALVDAVMAVAAYAGAHAHDLLELDVNPVLVLAQGRGVVAVDAMIRLTEEG